MRFDQEDLRALAAAAGQRCRIDRRPRPSYLVPLATAGMLAGLVVLFGVYIAAHTSMHNPAVPPRNPQPPTPLGPARRIMPPAAMASSRPAALSTAPGTRPVTMPIGPAVQVKLISAAIQRLPIQPAADERGGIFQFAPQPPLTPPVLVLVIEVHNRSSRPMAYRPWPQHPPLLEDERGRSYAMLLLADAIIAGQQRHSTSIAPGRLIRDVLLFQPPPPQAKSLKLHLAGENFGQGIELSIPADALQGR